MGRAVELGRQDEKTLLYWIAGHLKREGRQITERSARHLVEQVGTDMENLSREMEKLIAYTMGRTEITGQDIDDICTVQITNQIFDMVEAVARKEQKKALEYYYDLLALKEPPMRILYLLSRQFRLLLEVKELMKTGADKAKIASVAKLHPFVAGKYMQQCRNFTTRELREAMEEAAELEEREREIELKEKKLNTIDEKVVGMKESIYSHINVSEIKEICCDYSKTKAYETVKGLLSSGNFRYTAICSSNDLMMCGAYQALTEKGIKIPDDVSLIGFDDILISSLLNLTTIRQPFEEMGKNAMLQLTSAIASPYMLKSNIILSTGLIIRNSCKMVK